MAKQDKELLEDFQMFVTQMKEANRHGDALPHPWRLDDLVNRYRSYYESRHEDRL